MYSKFVKTVVKSPEEIYPTCLERSGMGKFSIPPTSKKVGWGKFLSHLPRWDRILAAEDPRLAVPACYYEQRPRPRRRAGGHRDGDFTEAQVDALGQGAQRARDRGF